MDGDSTDVFNKEISSVKVSLINSNSDGSYALNGKIMLCTVTLLFFFVFLILALHTYARWYLHSRRRRRHRRPTRLLSSDAGAAVCNDGLDVTTLKSLPTFTYAADQHPATAADCAVCLSEFENGESGRALPGCGHVFHLECIDMWFWSHSSCPLCRAAVKPREPQGGGGGAVVVELRVELPPAPAME